MQILIRGPKELKDFLQAKAKTIGIPLNSLVLQILWEWVKRNEKTA